ncbi:MAG: hypothetical protein J1G38_06270 [Clostridiales bacterium]|nr:hypothetical protein [Clostridiales bacterium]
MGETLIQKMIRIGSGAKGDDGTPSSSSSASPEPAPEPEPEKEIGV